MGKYNLGQEFDEHFLNAMNFQMKLNQQRDEANQDMMYKLRQQSLLEDYRAKDYELDLKKYQLDVDEFNASKTKPQTFDIEGRFENDATGTYWTFNKNSGKYEDTGIPFEKTKSDTAKEDLKKSEEEKKSQAKYNAIMGSSYVDMEDLTKQGLVFPKVIRKVQGEDGMKDEIVDNPATTYGGAYIFRSGSGEPKLIYSDEELQSLAEKEAPNAPNKWKRTKKETKDKFKVGQIYIDDSGNKAKYLGNDKWEDVK